MVLICISVFIRLIIESLSSLRILGLLEFCNSLAIPLLLLLLKSFMANDSPPLHHDSDDELASKQSQFNLSFIYIETKRINKCKGWKNFKNSSELKRTWKCFRLTFWLFSEAERSK